MCHLDTKPSKITQNIREEFLKLSISSISMNIFHLSIISMELYNDFLLSKYRFMVVI